MISFNVLGCCVSRDILNPLIARGGYHVLNYAAFANPISMFAGKGDYEVTLEDLKGYTGSKFGLRCAVLDMSKKTFDFVFSKKSDYIIVDIVDARTPMVKKGDHIVTLMLGICGNRKKFNERYGFDTYEDLSPYDISDEAWNKTVDELCKQLLKHYTPSQIILHKFYGVEKIACKTEKKFFSQRTKENIRKYNPLCRKLFARMEKNLKGCHTIEFPVNTVADEEHQLGRSPLHYNNLYYEYGANAVELITRNLPDEQEKKELSAMKAECEEKFRSLLTEIELREQLQLNKTALNFMNRLASDLLTEQKFTRWLQQCASDHSKIAVLRTQGSAWKILCKALEEYKIDVVFTSTQYNFDNLTEEELEQCRKADIIISASVHSTAPVTNGELTAIRIGDLIK